MRLKFQNINIDRTESFSEAILFIYNQYNFYIDQFDNDFIPVSLNIFCCYHNRNEYLSAKRIIDDRFSDISDKIIISVIGEPPADGTVASAELMLASKSNSDIKFINSKKHLQIQIEYPQGRLYFFEPFESDLFSRNVFLEYEETIIRACGMSNIVRAWHYVPDIIGFTNLDGRKKQNYQIVNEQREKAYSHTKWESGYPAATGIGQVKGNCLIQAVGFVPNNNAKIIKISNPLQIDPAKYSDSVIISGKKTPKFERAKLILSAETGLLFISGTASISGENTLYINDPVGQTLKTIENINALKNKVSKDYNIDNNGFTDSHFRVYIKNKSDIDTIRNICESNIESDSINYVIADICRANLLVEIEAYFNICGNFKNII